MLKLHKYTVIQKLALLASLSYNSYQCLPRHRHFGIRCILDHILPTPTRRNYDWSHVNKTSYLSTAYYILAQLPLCNMFLAETQYQLSVYLAKEEGLSSSLQNESLEHPEILI